jgi:hypothetical protein|nr:MAG TPA: hypothetical protein [Caudoviricetes sp.]
MASELGTVEKMLEVAKAEVGYLEKASNAYLDSKTANAGYNNYTKYNRDCGFGNGPSWYWCNSYISWVAMKAGVSTSIIPKTASCAYTKQFFQARGKFNLRTSGYKPVKGDLVLFSTSGYPYGTGHIALVRAVDANYVYTYEGNTSSGSSVVPNGGAVCEKYYRLSNTNIYGYCHPAYVKKEDIEVIQNIEIFNIANKKVVTVPAIQKNGENYVRLRSIADKFGCAVGYDSSKNLASFDTMPLQKLNLVVNGETKTCDGLFRLSGTNFFAIRDILTGIFGIPSDAITWDEETKTINVAGSIDISYRE